VATEATFPATSEFASEEPEAQRIQPERNQAAIDLLRSWREVDETGRQEQRETLEALAAILRPGEEADDGDTT
jgi:hypothetical protein